MRNFFQCALLQALIIIPISQSIALRQTKTLHFCISPHGYADPQGYESRKDCQARCGGHSRCHARTVQTQTVVGIPAIGAHLPSQSHIVTGSTPSGAPVVAPISMEQAPVDQAVVSMRQIPQK